MREAHLSEEKPTAEPPHWQAKLIFWIAGGYASLLVAAGLIVWQLRQPVPPQSPTAIGGMVAYQKRSDFSMRVTNPTDKASDQNPAFFDDHMVVFTRFRDGYNTGPAALIKLDLTTGQEEVIWQDKAQNVSVNGNPFTPDRSRLCYSSDVVTTDEIWCLNLITKERQQMTKLASDQYQFFEPSVRHDGQRIAFEVHGASKNDSRGQIWLADFSGDTQPLITAGDVRLPMFNPRDECLLFQRGIEDYYQLVVRQPNGSEQVLSLPTQGGTDASWATSDEIVYSGEDASLAHPNIFSYNLQTGRGKRETNEPAMEDGAPAVSPDGRWLAFESHTDETGPSRLWVRDRTTPTSGATPTVTTSNAVDRTRLPAAKADLTKLQTYANSYEHYTMADFDRLKHFDIIALEPYETSPELLRALRQNGSIVVGYLSIGQADDQRRYWKDWKGSSTTGESTLAHFGDIPKFNLTPSDPMFIGEDPGWPGSYFVDMSNHDWWSVLLESEIPYILQLTDYQLDGFMLDVVDVVDEYEGMDREQEMRQGMIDFLAKLRRQYPTMLLVPNRGFSIGNDIGNLIDAWKFEELTYVYGNDPRFSNFGAYHAQILADSTRDNQEEIDRVTPIFRRFGKPIFVLDHLQTHPLDTRSARQGYEQAQRLSKEWQSPTIWFGNSVDQDLPHWDFLPYQR